MDAEKGLRILHVIDSGGLYGAEIMLLNLVSEQMKLGNIPVIASIGEPHCAEKPLEAEAERRGIQVKRFRMRAGPNIAGAFRIVQVARKEKFHLLHSHGYKGNILFGFMPRSVRRMPMVSTLHGWTSAGGLNRMAVYERLDGLSLGFIDRVVVVSDAMREHERVKKLDRNKVLVVKNGIPARAERAPGLEELDRQIVDFCGGGVTIGAVGRLSPEKGFGVLLHAVRHIADTHAAVRLLILGEGSERSALEATVRKLGLEKKVLMPGYVDNAKMYLPLFHVFVLSSLTEGLPMVILEAMQQSVPVVATRVGGVPEVLEYGDSGMLVDACSPEQLASAIQRLLSDTALAESIAGRGVHRVRTMYSAAAMARNYGDVYEEVLRGSVHSGKSRATKHLPSA